MVKTNVKKRARGRPYNEKPTISHKYVVLITDLLNNRLKNYVDSTGMKPTQVFTIALNDFLTVNNY